MQLADALVEVELQGLAAKQYEHESIKARKDKKFISPTQAQGIPEAAAAAATLVAFEQNKGARVMIDKGAGKVSSVTLAEPVIPGGGDNNRLLWSVGTSHDGHGPLQDHRKLSDVAAAAVKNWIGQYADTFGINVAELVTANTGVTEQTIQIAYRRQYKDVEVEGAHVTATVTEGNLNLLGFDDFEDIQLETNPTISSDDAVAAVETFTGHSTNGRGKTEPKLKIISMATDNPGQTGKPNRGLFRGARKTQAQAQGQGPPFGRAYTHKLVWEVYPTFDEQTVETFVAQVDAESGEVYRFQDMNDYLEITGGVYPVTNDGVVPDGVEQSGW